MTSQGDSSKTNEFLRLRKLRLQQVREQSKDIAKKIRQRAKVVQSRHVDTNKEKEYLQCQEKLVSRLEQLCSKGLENVGAGHKNACEVNQQEIPERTDLSKLRGKEAVAILKRKKQDKLDEQKKLLDRKLQARETANVLSREKFSAVANLLVKSSSGKSVNEVHSKGSENIESNKDKPNPVAKNDMGTQWEFEEIPNEWEPNVPTLSILNDDSIKNSDDNNAEKADSNQKNKRRNLFALSDEMPSSLRGGITSSTEEILPTKPSLTVVSEYLQNRRLRLREPDTTHIQKNNVEDLKTIKDTLLRTRASRIDGSVFPNLCHVLDEQIIPVPCWKSERNCGFCPHANDHNSRHHQNNTNNNNFNKKSISKPCCQHLSLTYEKPSPYLRCIKLHQGLKIPVSGRSTNIEHSSKSDTANRILSKKNSVTMYDHNTRDTHDFPHNIDKLVVRDQSIDDDAYSQAVKEASVINNNSMQNHVLQQEARNRLAIKKQNVDKEYRDTMAFLNSLPKEKPGRSVRTAYIDGYREQEVKDRRQHKLQKEYKKIEKECRKHQCKHTKHKSVVQEQNRSKSKSPIRIDLDNNMVNRDLEYSWLPIPESDGNLAIHTIPNTLKNDKPGNTVKFSSVDTYHEYRSRHKHTPPTKDVDKGSNKRVVEAVVMQENSNDSMDFSSETDTSSVENLKVKNSSPSNEIDKDRHLSDAERIIIYKIVETKKAKKHKTKNKFQEGNKIDKSYQKMSNKNVGIGQQDAQNFTRKDEKDQIKTNTVSFSELKEGVYKSVSENGDNIASLYFSDDQHEESCNQGDKGTLTEKVDNGKFAKIGNNNNENSNRKPQSCDNCKHTDSHRNTGIHPSAATSTSSFKTAVNNRVNNVLLDDGCIKFVEEGGQDSGKFYVGASGFLKDEAYEVIIQLRKKEAEKISNDIPKEKSTTELRSSPENNIEKNVSEQKSVSVKPMNQLDSSKNFNEAEKPKSPTNDISDLLTTKNNTGLYEQIPMSDHKITTSKDIIDVSSKQEKCTGEAPEIIDKGISTTFRDDFAIPDNIPKLDPIPRPATSIHTQTTQNSPISRPVLMHLSSSTSTTYMSPPELVLPRYLRKGSSESCDDPYEPVLSNSQNMKFSSCKVCRCGKCKRRTKVVKADTPPNTTRSTGQTTDNFVNEKQYKKCTTTASRHKNVTSHKCKNRINSKICNKKKFKRSATDNRRFHSGSNYSTLLNKKRTSNLDKVNLNPLIENYVKKLLALNKEGLKAIEVVNQECSAVDTPGSSIIDVPNNVNRNVNNVESKISLEQIKNRLKEQMLKNIGNSQIISKCTVKSTGSQTEKNIKPLYKSNKKRPVHKVKSLNISKQLMKTTKENRRQSAQSTIISISPCSVNSQKENACSSFKKRNINCKNSLCAKEININQEFSNRISNSETSKDSKNTFHSRNKLKTSKTVTKIKIGNEHHLPQTEKNCQSGSYYFPSHRATLRSQSSESDASNAIPNRPDITTPPISISTQTNQVDSEVEFMKLAENKLQNMEKIANLTEKCTKRLSNLAKVLQEVRKNKSLAYSQITTSDCTSDSDNRSDKNIQTSNDRVNTFNPTVGIQTLTESLSSMPTSSQKQKKHNVDVLEYVPILKNLPTSETLKTPSPLSFSTENNKTDVHIVMEQHSAKNRGKPPPALTRVNLRHAPDGFVVPHELSTVVEVDSPMSIKLKTHTTFIGDKNDVTDPTTVDDIDLNKIDYVRISPDDQKISVHPNCLPKSKHQPQSTDTSDDSKMKMMDLKYFNDIMLKPFISLKEYAKQYNLEEPNDQNSLNGISKDENINDEFSSLHSEASLPDVMAELLKRNLISEPFKFETTSNVNSTNVSSESTISMLALSRARKNKKSAILVKDKENIAETSASLSISSNPDLEHAFRRLGMGWASSTLKKTKERLALSSSSNTSSSSIPQFKIKSFNYQDVPELSSLLDTSNKEEVTKAKGGNANESPKNALQQTSLTNSMTVKEFLANELANKITFSNKTDRNTTEREYISLCETKIPEEMKHMSQKVEVNEKSVNSVASGINNRARTSTPVQIFKSMTYHSTSSSNTSNGFFSNADDLSSVKGTSNSIKNHSTSDKDDLTIPNYSLKMRKETTECSKSD